MRGIRHYIDLIEAAGGQRFYDPAAVWLHGGPMHLEGDALKRYGKSHSDMGALFFCKDVPVGRWYTATYAGTKGRVWTVKLSPPVDAVFDLTNSSHRARLRAGVSYTGIRQHRQHSRHQWPHGLGGCR
jgi:hypothetical protein